MPNTKNKTGDTTQTQETKPVLYELKDKDNGERWLVVATSPEDAVKQAGLTGKPVAVREAPFYRKYRRGLGTRPMVSVPTETCPYQYAACKRPSGKPCTFVGYHPDLHEWMKSAMMAHLCSFTGIPLFKKDHELKRKWLTIEEALAEFSCQ